MVIMEKRGIACSIGEFLKWMPANELRLWLKFYKIDNPAQPTQHRPLTLPERTLRSMQHWTGFLKASFNKDTKIQ